MTTSYIIRVLFSLAMTTFVRPVFATDTKTYDSDWGSLDTRPTPAWYTDAKFGIFIHWGLFSVPAWAPTEKDFRDVTPTSWHTRIGMRYAEWYWQRIATPEKANDFGYNLFRAHHARMYGEHFRYQDFAQFFKAEYFDPSQWAAILKNSGAKYVVLTSKHHEGYTMWPSAQSWNWNVMDVGPHRDLLGELTSAVKESGLKMGYYYSLYEWFNPRYSSGPLEKYVDEHMLPQMKDLVMRYRPDVLWADGQWDHPSSEWKSPQFLAWLFNESPVKETVAVNDRWGNDTWGKHGGFLTVEYGNLGDMQVNTEQIERSWEECRGMGYSFGYNANESLEDYQTSELLVHELIAKVSRGGNFLLNIGPTADGCIPVIMQQRLHDIGKWLKTNGESIYGTQIWKDRIGQTVPDYVSFTRKGNDLFVICTRYPSEPIAIKLSKKPAGVSLLGTTFPPVSHWTEGMLTLTASSLWYREVTGEYAWVFKLTDAL